MCQRLQSSLSAPSHTVTDGWQMFYGSQTVALQQSLSENSSGGYSWHFRQLLKTLLFY